MVTFLGELKAGARQNAANLVLVFNGEATARKVLEICKRDDGFRVIADCRFLIRVIVRQESEMNIVNFVLQGMKVARIGKNVYSDGTQEGEPHGEHN